MGPRPRHWQGCPTAPGRCASWSTVWLVIYEKCTAALNTKKDELKKKEAEFLAAARSNSASATQSFLDKYVKMTSYHSDADKINRELNAIIESRLEEVCKHEGCERGSVLVTCFTDRSSVSV